MSTGTSIEWTEVTWNPTTGCDRILPGCDNCYGLTLAKRLKAMGSPKYQNDGDSRTRERYVVVVSPAAINDSAGYGWILALEITGDEPDGLLAVEIAGIGWVSPRNLDALYKTSFQEQVDTIEHETMERIGRMLRVALDL